jgi:hypothetical protein
VNPVCQLRVLQNDMPDNDLITDRGERELLERLDGMLLKRQARAAIDTIVERVELQLSA